MRIRSLVTKLRNSRPASNHLAKGSYDSRSGGTGFLTISELS
jgi:hypothetical protein